MTGEGPPRLVPLESTLTHAGTHHCRSVHPTRRERWGQGESSIEAHVGRMGRPPKSPLGADHLDATRPRSARWIISEEDQANTPRCSIVQPDSPSSSPCLPFRSVLLVYTEAIRPIQGRKFFIRPNIRSQHDLGRFRPHNSHPEPAQIGPRIPTPQRLSSRPAAADRMTGHRAA